MMADVSAPVDQGAILTGGDLKVLADSLTQHAGWAASAAAADPKYKDLAASWSHMATTFALPDSPEKAAQWRSDYADMQAECRVIMATD
jgi:hypothetical protein